MKFLLYNSNYYIILWNNNFNFNFINYRCDKNFFSYLYIHNNYIHIKFIKDEYDY